MKAPRHLDLVEDETPLHQFLTYRLSRVQAKLNAQATRILSETAGLSLTQWRILSLIGSRGQATSAELIRESAFDKGQFSRRLRTLIEDGYVAAEDVPNDGRAQRLTLTPKGAAIHAELLPRMRRRQAALRASLSPAELASLLSALDKLEIAADETDYDA